MTLINDRELGIVSYEASNIGSLISAISEIELRHRILRNSYEILDFDGLLLIPGVGAFGTAMEYLASNSMKDAIKQVAGHTPILGICLGMQILADIGVENGLRQGLGLMRGQVLRLKSGEDARVPNVGWRTIKSNPGFDLDHFDNNYFYFCHSYYFQPGEDTETVAYIEWNGESIPAIICDKSKRTWGIQFHPEKSGRTGVELLTTVLSIMCKPSHAL